MKYSWCKGMGNCLAIYVRMYSVENHLCVYKKTLYLKIRSQIMSNCRDIKLQSHVCDVRSGSGKSFIHVINAISVFRNGYTRTILSVDILLSQQVYDEESVLKHLLRLKDTTIHTMP